MDTSGPRILIIGAGFSGLGMAMRLKRAGIHDFRIVEKEPGLGGTWFVNTYPGCACDVQSHMYSFSFEPNPDWSREFASQPEILAYLERCADKYGLREHIDFLSQAVSARYDEQRCEWRVEVADAREVERVLSARGLKPGDAVPRGEGGVTTRELRAQVVVAGMGGLSTPAYPEIEGLDRFRGETFHSQRWNHEYDLRGKRVAVIGTGASAIQFVPAIQPEVAHLDVYQRTPPWILPKRDRPISKLERALYRRIPGARLLRRAGLYAALESRAVGLAIRPDLVRLVEPIAKAYLRLEVRDRALREKLTPDYALGCKRVLLTNDWYDALTQPNVDVVTTGIREVREHAVVDAEGVERPADAIIYGTGFRIADLLPPNTIFGRGGVDVVDLWPEGPEAYKGTTLTGCPNLFMLMGPNTGLGHNSIIYMIESQLNYVMDALERMQKYDILELEVKPEAQARFNQEVQARSQHTVWNAGGCQSYYLHPETGRNFAVWPDFTFRFRWLTRRFDAANYRERRATTTEIAARAAE